MSRRRRQFVGSSLSFRMVGVCHRSRLLLLALSRVADPFLTFWYRFVAPLAHAKAVGQPHSLTKNWP
jgi:hypothetical protein